MPTKNIAPNSDPLEELPITEPAAENREPMPGRVAKRPFVLENRRGSGRGNMTLMITVVGVILLFGIGMLAFLSSTKTTKKKTTVEPAKPNLGRVQTGSASGDLILRIPVEVGRSFQWKWAADSGVMRAAIQLRCGPHFSFHRNRGPHGVIAAHIEWNQRPRWNVTVAHMERNRGPRERNCRSGSGREQ